MPLRRLVVAAIVYIAAGACFCCLAQGKKPVAAFESPKPCGGHKVFVTSRQEMYRGPDTFSEDLGSIIAGAEFPCVQVGSSIGKEYARVKLPDGTDGYLDMLWLSYKDNRTFFKSSDGITGYLVGTGLGDAPLDFIILPVHLPGGSTGQNQIKIRDIQSIQVDHENGKVSVTKTSGQTIVGTTEPEQYSLQYVTRYCRETLFITNGGSSFPFSKFSGRLIRVKTPKP